METAALGEEGVSSPCVTTEMQLKLLEGALTLAEPIETGLHNLFNIIVQRYEGERLNGLFHGQGVAAFPMGNIYKGTFSEGFMHGKGLYTWADGVTYEGDFVWNVPTGQGSYCWLDGSRYEGGVCVGLRHGCGTYKCGRTGTFYEGQWHYGKKHGKGKIYYNPRKTSWYEGGWVQNTREGWGVRCYSSGNMYVGEWKNNCRHGEGTMKWLMSDEQYKGQWENGVMHGLGTYTWCLKRVHQWPNLTHNEYTGSFVQGLRQGWGRFFYANGTVYEGQWHANKKHGEAKLTSVNGQVFKGKFVEDCMAVASEPSGISDLLHCDDGESGKRPKRYEVPDMALEIQSLLEGFPSDRRDVEFREVEYVVLRYILELRTVYRFYSRLGHDQESHGPFLLTRLQFCRLLLDCSLQRHGLSVAQMEQLIRRGAPAEEYRSLYDTMMPREMLSGLVIISYHIYHKVMQTSGCVVGVCFTKLMKEDILPNARHVKGVFLSSPHCFVAAGKYVAKCWEVYHSFCEPFLTMRGFMWMLKELELYDDQLTSSKVVEILHTDSPEKMRNVNLAVEIGFLEMFEALLRCVELKRSENSTQSSECPNDLNIIISPNDTCDIDAYIHNADEREKFKMFHMSLPGETKQKQAGGAGDTDEKSKNISNPSAEQIHHFFTNIFIPAFERRMFLRKEVHEEHLRQETGDNSALDS